MSISVLSMRPLPETIHAGKAAGLKCCQAHPPAKARPTPANKKTMSRRLTGLMVGTPDSRRSWF
ncbi:conserved hypothetical protein [Ricinus communis]|uniref:Uncharacterized protein n=1 Tax=Ricinus communis TaxID=3988 RepID=B9TJZ0_RICCO|nr:conserved hypothetical protein [Ricinus communis]